MTGPQTPPALAIRIAGGATIVVPARIDLLTPYVLLEQEDWFEDEIRFLRTVLQPGARVVDIGANYGLYTLSLAAAVGAAGHVWAVEPASATMACLQRSIDANGFGHVTLLRTALSDREGTARLSVGPNAELNSLADGGGSGATEEVPLTTLDALDAALDWGAVDFLKLDAEGEEDRIVAGGARFLRAAGPLVMFEIRHGAQLNLGLVERMSALGYAPYRLLPGHGLLVPWDPDAPLDPFQLNLFACKPDRAASLERAGRLERDPGARYAKLHAACASASDAARLADCANLAHALGERRQAIDLLNRAIPVCGSPALLAALLGELVALSAFSGYFAQDPAIRDTMLRQLEALKATGHMTAPMARRRQLLRIAAGLQAGPEADPLLAARAPDNLNPGLWGG